MLVYQVHLGTLHMAMHSALLFPVSTLVRMLPLEPVARQSYYPCLLAAAAGDGVQDAGAEARRHLLQWHHAAAR